MAWPKWTSNLGSSTAKLMGLPEISWRGLSSEYLLGYADLVTTNMDILRQVLVKKFALFTDRAVSFDKQQCLGPPKPDSRRRKQPWGEQFDGSHG